MNLQVDDSYESSEFCLQFCYGKVCSDESSTVSFHQAYTGPNTSHLVKHLRVGAVYSFRVCSRSDPDSNWCIWSVPRQAATNLQHYRELCYVIFIHVKFITCYNNPCYLVLEQLSLGFIKDS